jgi:ectoine hydroxylase-related dioxygenase (phytanoyl-CoA dioxygenase family)
MHILFLVLGNIMGEKISNKEEFRKNGFIIQKNLLTQAEVNILNDKLIFTLEQEQVFNKSKNYKRGVSFFPPYFDYNFIQFVIDENKLSFFNEILGENIHLYLYMSSTMFPSETNYSGVVHKDFKYFIPGECQIMGLLIALDDFNEYNGATYILPQSHTKPERPTDEYFDKNAIQLNCNKGDFIFFDARIWHKGGTNQSELSRSALALGVCKDYIKPYMNFSALLKDKNYHLNEYQRKILGFNKFVPASFDEYHL